MAREDGSGWKLRSTSVPTPQMSTAATARFCRLFMEEWLFGLGFGVKSQSIINKWRPRAGASQSGGKNPRNQPSQGGVRFVLV